MGHGVIALTPLPLTGLLVAGQQKHGGHYLFHPVTPSCEPNKTPRSILLGPGMKLRTRIVGALRSGGHNGINMGLPRDHTERDSPDGRSSIQPGSQLPRIRTMVASGKGLGGGSTF